MSGLLDDLKKWLKKAKDKVDSVANPSSELTSAHGAATTAIELLNSVLSTPEPGSPSHDPHWDESDREESMGACMGTFDNASHFYAKSMAIETREALVVCRWAIRSFIDALTTTYPWVPPPGTGGAGGLLDDLKKWLDKAKKKVDSAENPTTELQAASAEAQAVINTLTDRLKTPAPHPPDLPLSAGSAKQYMAICMAFYTVVDAEYDIGDENGARAACVECKWAIDSFIAWLGY